MLHFPSNHLLISLGKQWFLASPFSMAWPQPLWTLYGVNQAMEALSLSLHPLSAFQNKLSFKKESMAMRGRRKRAVGMRKPVDQKLKDEGKWITRETV